ncbi:MAG: PEGA domain-containing protein [Acidobacteriaceae bacterium]
MGDLISFFSFGIVLGTTAAIAALVTVAAVVGEHNKYVVAASMVIEKFTIEIGISGAPFISISGRRKGLVSWILTNLGLEGRVELSVTEKDWTLRSGSLAGMSVIHVPLKNIKATICGYQRSLAAFFLATFFALNAVWTLLSGLPLLAQPAGQDMEAFWEAAAKGWSAILFQTLGWLVACGFAALFYYSSKRVAFGVDTGRIFGIAFKRSFIENKVIDITTAEQATTLLNQLVASAVYGLPISQVEPTPARSRHNVRTIKSWMPATLLLGVLLIAIVLSRFGNGVRLEITTLPIGTAVWLDSQFVGTTSNDMAMVVRHATRENHTLQFQHTGYEPSTKFVYLTKFESSFNVVEKLTLLNYPLTLSTTPGGAHVALDGNDIGTTNPTGILLIPKVDRGTHQLTVSCDGYRTDTEKIDIYGRNSYHVELLSNAQAAMQDAAAKQLEVVAHINNGNMLYRQGQYAQALAECAAALNLNPANGMALALRKKIEQTQKVLGQ